MGHHPVCLPIDETKDDIAVGGIARAKDERSSVWKEAEANCASDPRSVGTKQAGEALAEIGPSYNVSHSNDKSVGVVGRLQRSIAEKAARVCAYANCRSVSYNTL
jgi:hypothetical protein